MKQRTYILVMVFACAFALLVCTGNAHAADEMTWGDLYGALNAGGTVTLTNDVTAQADDPALEVPAGVTVTLDLNGHTLDRGLTEAIQNGCVIHVLGSLTLKDSGGTGLITGGFSKNNGGGILVEGGSLTMEGGAICENSSSNASGGGVCITYRTEFTTFPEYVYYPGSFTMLGGSICENTAYSSGGGMIVIGSAFTMKGGSIRANSFKGNSGAPTGVGAEISTAIIQDPTDAFNAVNPHYNVYRATFLMEGGEICENVGKNGTNGGGIHLSGADFIMRGGRIRDNSIDGGISTGISYRQNSNTREVYCYNASTILLEDGEISGNDGNGVYISGGSFLMRGGKISENTGSGLYIHLSSIRNLKGEDVPYPGSFIMEAGEISGNMGTSGAGAKIVGETFVMRGGTICGNTTDHLGSGSVYVGCATLHNAEGGSDPHAGRFLLEDGEIRDNVIQSGGGVSVGIYSECIMSGGAIRNNTAEYSGAVEVSAGSFTMTGGVIENNTATKGACGGVSAGGSPVTNAEGERVLMPGTILLEDGVIRNNTAAGDGGGVYIKASNFTMRGGTIEGNAASGSGGGVYLGWNGTGISSSSNFRFFGSTCLLEGGQIRDNTAKEGGGVYVLAGTLTLNGCEICGNTASGSGGGVSIREMSNRNAENETVFYQSTFLMENGVLRGNAASSGGGVSVSISEFTMRGGSIEGNTADGLGGGVCLEQTPIRNADGKTDYYGSTFLFEDGQITGNEASGSGGGVYVKGCDFTMRGGSISGNSSGNAGGGACILVDNHESYFLMEDGQICENTALSGGGLYLRGDGMTMRGGSVSGNTAQNGGGGFYLDLARLNRKEGGVDIYPSELILEDGEIRGNTASGGGGFYICGSTLTMRGGMIADNSTTYNGGGVDVMYTWDDGPDGSQVFYAGSFLLEDGEICGNTATDGAGVFVQSGTFTMNGGDIHGNSTTTNVGAGVCILSPEESDAQTQTIFNMNGGTIRENAAARLGGGVFIDEKNTVFSLSGSPVISGNVSGGTITDGTLTGGTANNLYLLNWNCVLCISVTGEISEDACVGISLLSVPGGPGPIVFTRGLTAQGRIGAFSSDDEAYFVDWSADGNEAALYRDASAQIRGDMNGDGLVTSDDAIYLLRHTLQPDRYPIEQSGDVNGDGLVTSDDAIYLLRHTLQPERYPLQ